MGKIAFLFPGQGAQQVGMGQDFYENNPHARAIFDQLEAQRSGTLALCFEGAMETLSQTIHTQPCLFACELAAAHALIARGIVPDMLAGFSLGEVAALSCSGAVSLTDGFSLVCQRAALMQNSAEQIDTAMAAVLKLDNATVEGICAQFEGVYPVNYNCPGQVTVACLREQLAPFSAAVKTAGGRAMPLKVSGGFHSVFMHEAAQSFADVLAQVDIQTPKIPLYANVTGKPYAGDPRTLLAQQIENPVRWEAIVRDMIAQGVTTMYEVGAGTVLAGLVKKIDPSVTCHSISTSAQLDAITKEA